MINDSLGGCAIVGLAWPMLVVMIEIQNLIFYGTVSNINDPLLWLGVIAWGWGFYVIIKFWYLKFTKQL